MILCFLAPAMRSPADYGVPKLKSAGRRMLLLLARALEQFVLGPRPNGEDDLMARTEVAMICCVCACVPA